MSNSFQIVSPRLLISNVCIYACISSSTRQIFAFSKWYVFSIRIFITFRQSKINYVDTVFCCFSPSYQKIVWLYISVNNPLFMHFLNSLDQLNCNLQNSFQVKFSPAFLKQIFQALAQLVHDHHMICLAFFSFLISYKV